MQWLTEQMNNKPKIKRTIISFIGKLKKSYMFLVNKIFGVNERKVVFISFNGKSYSDNPKAISEKLNEMHPEFQIVWLFNEPDEKKKIVPDYIKCIKRSSIRALTELATAKIWVDNFNKPLYSYKSKKQIYIQTWHGDRGFKKMLYDSPFVMNNTKYIEQDICDLIVSGSEFADRVYRTAFKYNGEIMRVGCPRNDKLTMKDSILIDSIKRYFNVHPTVKILLYAPTLRREASDNNVGQPIGEIDLSAVIEKLEEKTKEKWICFLRAHSAVPGLEGVPQSTKFIDVTLYEDMNDLLLVTDLLITDYSSSAGDFALLNRPIFLFQNDRETFIKYDRTFYFDIEESPFYIAKDQGELIYIIENMDMKLAHKNCKEILEFYGTYETGKAAEEVVNFIYSKHNYHAKK